MKFKIFSGEMHKRWDVSHWERKSNPQEYKVIFVFKHFTTSVFLVATFLSLLFEMHRI